MIASVRELHILSGQNPYNTIIMPNLHVHIRVMAATRSVSSWWQTQSELGSVSDENLYGSLVVYR